VSTESTLAFEDEDFGRPLSVGQWEREAIGERTKAALKSKRERG